MGMKDFFKKMVSLPPEDDYEDDDLYEDEPSFFEEDEEKPSEKTQTRSFDFASSGKKSSSKTAPKSSSQVQVVLVKPTRFEDAPSIADHLNERKTVVLNLESANRETSRRLIDFLSGTAYATRGSIKRVANSTYIITPVNVDVLGELIAEDIDTDGMFLE